MRKQNLTFLACYLHMAYTLPWWEALIGGIMIQMGKFVGLAATVTGALLFSQSALCSESGKIYTNGRWVEAQTVEEVSTWNSASILGTKAPINLLQLAKRFVDSNSRIFGLGNNSGWALKSTFAGEILQTARLKRLWNGLEVIGGEAVVQIENGKAVMGTADELELGGINAARISATDAEAMAFASYQGAGLSAENAGLKVLVLGQDENKDARLVYQVTVNDRDGFSSDVHFIDAERGNELLVTTNVHTIKDRKVLAGAGNESDMDLDEKKWRTVFADKGCSGSAPRSATPRACTNLDAKIMASAKAAWENSGMVYDYFQNTHRRDSIDGKGLQLKSVVNFGEAFSNAAWVKTKGVMIYGMGDGKEMNDFATALDVAGHELTHGVTSSTSELEYVSESGALNESYSDVFGKIVAIKNGRGFNDWKLGKELFKDGKSSIRDMENPEVGHMNKFKYKGEQCSRMNDFCGVHSNSGIPNKAAVMIAKRLGYDKIGKLYYMVLTQMLRTNSSFKEARAQTEAACGKLFSASSADCAIVRQAFTSVGIQ